MTVLTNEHIVLVPIRNRRRCPPRVNVGYLKLTQQPTWNPF